MKIKYLAFMFLLIACSGDRGKVLSYMSKQVISDQTSFQKAIKMLEDMQNLEYLSYSKGSYSAWIKLNDLDIEEFYDSKLEELSRKSLFKKNKIEEYQIKELSLLLDKLNCKSIRRYLRLDNKSLAFESTCFLSRYEESRGYYFHFYKSRASLQDKLRLKDSNSGFFVTDSIAVYYKP